MKKRICLQILAVIMAAALILPAGAVFSDEGQIGTQYVEAVRRMAELGVLNGFPDGSFQPDGTLTREQGAKIVAYIVLGGNAEELECCAAPFEDVAVYRWSAPCIAWCAGREILLGYGDGRFGPADTLTGDQFAKMLLCALGLAREGNYVGLGDAWSAAVRGDGDACGLYEGDYDMASSLPISRQQAALMAFNAISAAESLEDGLGGDGTTNPSDPYVPDDPDDPNDPNDPNDPDEPDGPQQPDDPGSGTGQQPQDSGDPQDPGQGDDSGEAGSGSGSSSGETETPTLPDPNDPDDPTNPTDPDPGSGENDLPIDPGPGSGS